MTIPPPPARLMAFFQSPGYRLSSGIVLTWLFGVNVSLALNDPTRYWSWPGVVLTGALAALEFTLAVRAAAKRDREGPHG